MDNQELLQLDQQQLTQLLVLFKNSPQQKKQDLIKQLAVTTAQLELLVLGLKHMGLLLKTSPQGYQLLHKIEQTDINKLKQKLTQAGIDKPVNYCLSTPSTNKLASTNKQAAIYLSEHQSTGKGRKGRHWLTPLGQSIALSVSHNFQFGLKHLSGLNIAMAVAITNTASHFGYNHLQLKWPN
ncbi:MAG TPA: hypothetical protein ENJ41_04355, partial [Oceanospirillales bacterium]|nr:hypothetical protein [Oceanospirillales bacterium]